MKITLIAAHDPNLLIGAEGGLPWRYPEDLKHFKKHTLDQTVVMGRGVFEELNEIPLPGRRNIVLSTSKVYDHVATYTSLDDVLQVLDDVSEVFIIGGGVLYNQTLPIADRLIITEIKKEYMGDTFFPEYRNMIGIMWREVKRDDHDDLAFVEYERI